MTKQDAGTAALDYYRREQPAPANAPKAPSNPDRADLDQMFGYYAA